MQQYLKIHYATPPVVTGNEHFLLNTAILIWGKGEREGGDEGSKGPMLPTAFIIIIECGVHDKLVTTQNSSQSQLE